jgi:monoamine oxidase
MPRAGLGILEEGDDYLNPRERAERREAKIAELFSRRLTPDWFRTNDFWCLPPRTSVAVIGGGFAGLAAAWYLHACGVRVTVFEVTDRVGGRVLTDRTFVPGKTVEAGAELIGENHALWWYLSREFRLELQELSDYGLDERIRFGAHDLNPEEKKRLKRVLPGHFRKIGAQARPISQTAPWSSNGAGRFDAMSVADKLDELFGEASSTERHWFEFTLANDNCAEVARQSYLSMLASVSASRMGSDIRGMLGYWFSTETHRCVGGNQQLAGRIADSLPDVRLRTQVMRVEVISRDRRGAVRISTTGQGQSGRIRRDNFDFVVVATSPKMWGRIAFKPKLGAAGRTIQDGPAVKFLSRYTTAFWLPGSPNAKWDELGSVWEGTDKQRRLPASCLSVFSGGPHVLPAADYAPRLAALFPSGTPADAKFVNWPTVPFIETGYGVPAPGEVTTIQRRQVRPHAYWVYFAGDHTSSGFFGYMEGALQSGARAARDIVMRWALPCDLPAPPGTEEDDVGPHEEWPVRLS